jgi:hypothetical protein
MEFLAFLQDFPVTSITQWTRFAQPSAAKCNEGAIHVE